MAAVVATIVTIAVLLIGIAVAQRIIKKQLDGKPTPPQVGQGRPARPPVPPGMSFNIVRRTKPYEPPKAGPGRQTGPVNGDGFKPKNITVDTSSFCRLTGKRVLDCTCERCLKAKGAQR